MAQRFPDIRYDQLDNQEVELPFAVAETSKPYPHHMQEQGPDNLKCIARLYDFSTTPWRNGSYALKFMPKDSAGEITEAMANLISNAHPKGFININNNGTEPKCYSFDVELINQLQVEVYMLDYLHKFHIHFTSEEILTRSQIISQPHSRIPNACASVEFTIHSDCKTTTEGRFRIDVITDVERKSFDYNIIFIRKPQEPTVDRRTAHPY